MIDPTAAQNAAQPTAKYGNNPIARIPVSGAGFTPHSDSFPPPFAINAPLFALSPQLAAVKNVLSRELGTVGRGGGL
jgi:hypothetical protein